ncbi:hypothetical protein [Streptomyces exfoliatus]|uniref:hypothetical protein n=1 Tax=Streptomyces exfoliatus TaxID=1905 RepID=UPI003C3043B1
MAHRLHGDGLAKGNAARRKALEDLSRIPWKVREHRARRKGLKAAQGHPGDARPLLDRRHADTYTSLLPEADLAIAEATARLVPRARAPHAPHAALPDVPVNPRWLWHRSGTGAF